jgi:hypothetical protein
MMIALPVARSESAALADSPAAASVTAFGHQSSRQRGQLTVVEKVGLKGAVGMMIALPVARSESAALVAASPSRRAGGVQGRAQRDERSELALDAAEHRGTLRVEGRDPVRGQRRSFQ